jgi:hypothetical protein
MKIKISKNQWEQIGKKTGWIKESGLDGMKWVKDNPKGKEYLPKCDCKEKDCPICRKKKKLDIGKPLPKLGQKI